MAKLTLAEILAKKHENENRKPQSKLVYVESLGGEIEVHEPTRELLYKYVDKISAAKTTQEVTMAMCYFISQGIKEFQTKEFYDDYTPEIAVHKALIVPDDIKLLVEEMDNLVPGKGKLSVYEEVKN